MGAVSYTHLDVYKRQEDTNQTFIATFKVHNPAIFNKSIKEVALLSYPKFVISPWEKEQQEARERDHRKIGKEIIFQGHSPLF